MSILSFRRRFLFLSVMLLLNASVLCRGLEANPTKPGRGNHAPVGQVTHHGPHPAGGPSISATIGIGYSFCSVLNCADGEDPYSSLTAAADGYFYGTATGGPTGLGVIFQISSIGSYNIVYSFCTLAGCPDGEEPNNTLIQDEHGNLWGTTYEGGLNDSGTIFKITPGGKFIKMYDFCALASCADGAYPYGSSLVEGSDGNFYGMTYEGGVSGGGSVYKVTPSGAVTTLYSFCSLVDCADGEYPYGDLVQGSDGKLYGWTFDGGSNDSGALFSIATDGTGFSTLYSFCSLSNCADGKYPYYGGVNEASDGNYYGMTYGGGSNSSGEIFSISSTGTYTPLYSFCSVSGCDDGYYPYQGKLELGSDGNFYGTSWYGGANDEGLFFQVTPAGIYTPIYSFCALAGCVDGASPNGQLVQMEDGVFYGTTSAGGASGYGDAFSLALSPSMPGPLQMSFESPSVNVGQADSFDWFSSNSFSTTMQQCNAFADNLNTGTLYPLGAISGTLINGYYGGSFTTAATPAPGFYLVSVTCGGIETTYTEVEVLQVGTTVALTPVSSSLTSGQTEVFNAAVTAADSSTVNEGSVVLACNGATSGPIRVIAGVASLSVNTATVGANTYSCSATYSDGEHKYSGGQGTASIVAANQTTSVALVADGDLRQGSTVNLVATLSGQYFRPNYGTVTFSSLGWQETVPVDYSTGTASLTVSLNVPASSYTVTATYSGARGESGSSTQQTFTIAPPCSVKGPNPAC